MITVDLTSSHPYLAIKKSKRGGRGVFARTNILKGTAFLVDPIIFVPEGDCANYIFMDKGKTFLALGYGSLINHGYYPNTNWDCKLDGNLPTITFYALMNIKKNEEITHDYCWPEFPESFIK
jgi:SET domain-containing protein